MITSKANAQRAHNIGNGKTVYAVVLDGSIIDHIVAKSLPEANGIVRRALKFAYKSLWNQSLIFNGHLAEGEVSSLQMRTALYKITK